MIPSIFISFHPTATYHDSLSLSLPAEKYSLFHVDDTGEKTYAYEK